MHLYLLKWGHLFRLIDGKCLFDGRNAGFPVSVYHVFRVARRFTVRLYVERKLRHRVPERRSGWCLEYFGIHEHRK